MLVFNTNRKIFLGERLNEPGVWQLPQGGVDESASLPENVLRELEEELGAPADRFVIVKQLKATHEYDWRTVPAYAVGKWRGQAQTFWLVKFVGKESEIDLNRHTPEFSNWQWSELQDIPAIVEPRRIPGYTAALKEVEELFKLAVSENAR